MSRGLLPGGLRTDERQCVHFAAVPFDDPRYKYGMRHTSEAVVVVDTNKAEAQGVEFFKSEAGAILTPQPVSVDCIVAVTNRRSGALFFERRRPPAEHEEGPSKKKARTSLPPAPPRVPAPPEPEPEDTTNWLSCRVCSDVLPIGTLLCMNCLMDPLHDTQEAEVENDQDIDKYCQSTLKLADRFGVLVNLDEVKKPKCRKRGTRNPDTKKKKRLVKNEKRKAAKELAAAQTSRPS